MFLVRLSNLIVDACVDTIVSSLFEQSSGSITLIRYTIQKTNVSDEYIYIINNVTKVVCGECTMTDATNEIMV